jgi:hypothetical protein
MAFLKMSKMLVLHPPTTDVQNYISVGAKGPWKEILVKIVLIP